MGDTSEFLRLLLQDLPPGRTHLHVHVSAKWGKEGRSGGPGPLGLLQRLKSLRSFRLSGVEVPQRVLSKLQEQLPFVNFCF